MRNGSEENSHYDTLRIVGQRERKAWDWSVNGSKTAKRYGKTKINGIKLGTEGRMSRPYRNSLAVPASRL